MLKRAMLFAVCLCLGSTAPAARAQLAADYSENAGDWIIMGTFVEQGNAVVCKMQKSAEDGSVFAYVSTLSAGRDGIDVKALFVIPTQFPDGSNPRVVLSFDENPFMTLIGGVNRGYLHIDLAAPGVETLQRAVNLFQFSDTLTKSASLGGHPDETKVIDLSESEVAFEKNGICMKNMLDMGLARMGARKNSLPGSKNYRGNAEQSVPSLHGQTPDANQTHVSSKAHGRAYICLTYEIAQALQKEARLPRHSKFVDGGKLVGDLRDPLKLLAADGYNEHAAFVTDEDITLTPAQPCMEAGIDMLVDTWYNTRTSSVTAKHLWKFAYVVGYPPLSVEQPNNLTAFARYNLVHAEIVADVGEHVTVSDEDASKQQPANPLSHLDADFVVAQSLPVNGSDGHGNLRICLQRDAAHAGVTSTTLPRNFVFESDGHLVGDIAGCAAIGASGFRRDFTSDTRDSCRAQQRQSVRYCNGSLFGLETRSWPVPPRKSQRPLPIRA